MAKKIMISLDENVIERLDSEAKKIGLSRSAFITTALGEYINQREKANDIIQNILSSDNLIQALKESTKQNE